MVVGTPENWTFLTDCDTDISKYESVRSPLKFYVLDLVDSLGEVTYTQLAEESGMPRDYAADRLVKYAKKGLLTRERDGPGQESTFRLSSHGADRLLWFHRNS